MKKYKESMFDIEGNTYNYPERTDWNDVICTTLLALCAVGVTVLIFHNIYG